MTAPGDPVLGVKLSWPTYHRTGLCVWAKRLEQGRLPDDWSAPRTREMDWTGLKLMLEGIEPKRVRKRYRHTDFVRTRSHACREPIGFEAVSPHTFFSDFLNRLDDQLALHVSETGHHVEEEPAGGSRICSLRIVVSTKKDGDSLPDYDAISKTPYLAVFIRRRAAKHKANCTICGLYLDCGASANSGRVRSQTIVAAMPSARLKCGGPSSAKVGSIGVG